MVFDLSAVLEQIHHFTKTKPPPHLVLFKADWCPDCVRGVPAVEVAAAKAQVPLLVIDVGSVGEWKSPRHPLRLDPILSITSVPTLIELDKNDENVARKLGSELERASSKQQAEELATAFILAAITNIRPGTDE